jgi:hypothetical protein
MSPRLLPGAAASFSVVEKSGRLGALICSGFVGGDAPLSVATVVRLQPLWLIK